MRCSFKNLIQGMLRKIGIFIVILVAAASLSGCTVGSTIDTVLTINPDLSGSRVMTLTVDQNIYNQYFAGSVESLNSLLEKKCPKELSWSYDRSSGKMVYTFALDFISVADYKAKADAILGSGSDTVIEMTYADSIWADGLELRENFTSGDLMSWARRALVDAGMVKEEYASKTFSLGSNTVKCGEKEYSTGTMMAVDKISYIKLSSIDMLTDTAGYDTYTKTIVVTLPEESMTAKGEEIKSFFAEHTPEWAVGSWSTAEVTTDATDGITDVTEADALTKGNGTVSYTLVAEKLSGEKMQELLNTFFDTDKCVVKQADVTEGMSPFCFNVTLEEQVDLSKYLVGEIAENTRISYLVKGSKGYMGGAKLEALSGGAEGDADVAYPEYCHGVVRSNKDGSFLCSSAFRKTYPVNRVRIETKKSLFGDFTRSISFGLEGMPFAGERVLIIEKIEALGSGYKIEVLDKSKEADASGNAADSSGSSEALNEVEVTEGTSCIITIKQSGSLADIMDSSKAVFGSAGNLSYISNEEFYIPLFGWGMSESLGFGNFTDYVTEDLSTTYVLDTGFASTIQSVDWKEQDSVTSQGDKLTITNFGKEGYKVTVTVYQWNFIAIAMYIAIAAVIVAVVVLVIWKKKKHKQKGNAY